MATVTSKFSLNQTAYYVIYATASVYPVTITKVRVDPNTFTIAYDLRRKDAEVYLYNIPEVDVLTFEEAKAKLITYLEAKLTDINGLVAP